MHLVILRRIAVFSAKLAVEKLDMTSPVNFVLPGPKMNYSYLGLDQPILSLANFSKARYIKTHLTKSYRFSLNRIHLTHVKIFIRVQRLKTYYKEM